MGKNIRVKQEERRTIEVRERMRRKKEEKKGGERKRREVKEILTV